MLAGRAPRANNGPPQGTIAYQRPQTCCEGRLKAQICTVCKGKHRLAMSGGSSAHGEAVGLLNVVRKEVSPRVRRDLFPDVQEVRFGVLV